MANDDNVSWPSQSELARRCGLSRQHINTILKELEDNGYISVIERDHGNGATRSFLYRVNAPTAPEARAQTPEPDGFVYVMQLGEQCKVGIAQDVEKRRRNLTNSSGHEVALVQQFPMKISEARKVEAQAHEALQESRTKGEWFACSAEAATRAVQSALEGVNTDDTSVKSSDRGCQERRHGGVKSSDTYEPTTRTYKEPSGECASSAPNQTKPAKACRLPGDWQPKVSHYALAKELGFSSEDVDDEANTFRDHWWASDGQNARKRDWDRAFNNWLRKAKQFGRKPKQSSKPGNPALAAALKHRATAGSG
jgi:biotin operon repressor